ncbi:MAG: 5'-3' exonuclease H3TH domain-containing protein [Myxococcota bacterium]
MQLHLVDGTYELFRMHFGAPPATAPDGREVGATRALLRSLHGLLRERDVTHVGIAFDSVVESFRNGLFDGYKTGEGMDPALHAQFELAERAAAALGIVVWPMKEMEADDALCTAARRFADAPGVERIFVCSPDKDLCQVVRGGHIVTFDRRRGRITDEEGVKTKFGVPPAAIPDYLALVGDTADGIPGIPRWGAKSAARVLEHYGSLEAIPDDARTWEVKVRGAAALAENLATRREEAALYKRLATLRDDAPIDTSLEELRWGGVDAPLLAAVCEELGDDRFLARFAA